MVVCQVGDQLISLLEFSASKVAEEHLIPLNEADPVYLASRTFLLVLCGTAAFLGKLEAVLALNAASHDGKFYLLHP